MRWQPSEASLEDVIAAELAGSSEHGAPCAASRCSCIWVALTVFRPAVGVREHVGEEGACHRFM